MSNGFRLPSAMDNRPLRFPEFEAKLRQVVAVSATPGQYEIGKSCVSYNLSSPYLLRKLSPSPKGTNRATSVSLMEGDVA